jgi:hypothetical protein
MIFLRIVIPLYLLFEHDLRANASRLSRGKTGIHFSGSCSRMSSGAIAQATMWLPMPKVPLQDVFDVIPTSAPLIEAAMTHRGIPLEPSVAQ